MSDFVICINNDGNPASLIKGKVYRRLPGSEAEAHDMLRVVDEDKSEPEGYLYPASIFAPVEAARSSRAKEVMREISQNAQKRGLTPDILQSILDEK